MQRKALLFAAVLFAACGGLPMPGFLGGGGTSQTQVTQTSTSSSTQTEELNVNGQPVEAAPSRRDDDDDDDEVRPSKRKKAAAAPAAKKPFGKTCHRNEECEDEACFVGGGDLGYCTKMCSSWTECPTHWECKRANNAPQKICMQGG